MSSSIKKQQSVSIETKKAVIDAAEKGTTNQSELADLNYKPMHTKNLKKIKLMHTYFRISCFEIYTVIQI